MNFRIFEFTHHKFQVRHLKKRVVIYISCFYPLIFGCTIYFNITCFDSFGEGIKYALPNKSSISTSHIYFIYIIYIHIYKHIYIYIYIYIIFTTESVFERAVDVESCPEEEDIQTRDH